MTPHTRFSLTTQRHSRSPAPRRDYIGPPPPWRVSFLVQESHTHTHRGLGREKGKENRGLGSGPVGEGGVGPCPDGGGRGRVPVRCETEVSVAGGLRGDVGGSPPKPPSSSVSSRGRGVPGSCSRSRSRPGHCSSSVVGVGVAVEAAAGAGGVGAGSSSSGGASGDVHPYFSPLPTRLALFGRRGHTPTPGGLYGLLTLTLYLSPLRTGVVRVRVLCPATLYCRHRRTHTTAD